MVIVRSGVFEAGDICNVGACTSRQLILYTTINQKVANQNNITIYMTLERTWYDKCGVRSGGCIEMTRCGKDMTRMKCQNG